MVLWQVSSCGDPPLVSYIHIPGRGHGLESGDFGILLSQQRKSRGTVESPQECKYYHYKYRYLVEELKIIALHKTGGGKWV